MDYKKYNRYVFCYDIPNTKRRNKLIKCLEGYGFRVQKSIFEAVLDERLYKELEESVNKIIKEPEDSFFSYYMCLKCETKIKKHGIGSKENKGRERYFIV